MNLITTVPVPIGLRFGDSGWEILTPPGHLAQMLHQYSAGSETGIVIEAVAGKAMAVIPFNKNLDGALINLVDALISLRYATGNVQLELFSSEAV